MMLYEAQDGGTKKNRLHDIARGVQDMVDTYADEIDECTEYFNGLVRTAAALHRPKVEGGAE
jgi:phage-related minor tail protein